MPEEVTELIDISDVSKVPQEEPEAPTEQMPSLSEPRGMTGIASLRERFAAFFIDTILLFYTYWLLGMVYHRILFKEWYGPIPTTGWQGLSFHAGFLVVAFLYYFITEGVFFTTIGKFCVWMYVRRKDFRSPSMSRVFLRNFLRIVDYGLLFIPSLLLMDLTRAHQRIGDLIAGTIVIKKRLTIARPYNISKIASASGRMISSIIDIAIAAGLLCGALLFLNPDSPVLSMWLFLLAPLLPFLFFVISERIAHATLGKWLFGYAICHEDGSPMSLASSIVRTIFRAFDTNPFGIISVFLSGKRLRPGDIAAGTVVISARRRWKGGVAGLAWLFLAAGLVWVKLPVAASFVAAPFRVPDAFLNMLPRLESMEGILKGAGPLRIEHIRFKAVGQETIRMPPVFSPGETVHVTFDVYGWKPSGRMAWIQEDLEAKYPDGSIGLSQKNNIDFHQVVASLEGPIELTNNIAIPGTALVGTYTITLTVRDLFGHEEVAIQQTFEVRGVE